MDSDKKAQFFWIAAVILGTFVASLLALFFTSETEKVEANDKPKLVLTFRAEKTDQRIIVSAFGTVQANREITLRSEVPGRVVEQSPNLVVGGIVEKGEELLKIDPRDYLFAVEREKAAVERAQFELQLEKGRQVVAKREWEQLGPTIKKSELSEELALRRPHLKEKRAALEAALSQLEKAELDLKRTTLISPMDAVVITESIETGDYITPQTEIGRLAGNRRFRVQVSVPLNRLKWIEMPKGRDPGSRVRVIQDVGGEFVVKEGTILRLLSDLDPTGRMARILVAVDDPLGLNDPFGGEFPLLIGTYSRVEFEGPMIEDIFVIPRAALRENNSVWVMSADKELEIKEVSIIQKSDDFVFVDKGIAEGDEIIVSNLPLAIPGMQLRAVEEGNPT